MKSVFISHSSKDTATADMVVDYLEREGISVWIAPRDIPAGSNYGASITKGIRECTILVLMFSKESNDSHAVFREVQIAFDEKKVIIPLRIEDVPVSDNLSFYLSGLHWLDALPKQNNVNELVHDVKQVLQNIGTEIHEAPPRPQRIVLPPQRKMLSKVKKVAFAVTSAIGILFTILLVIGFLFPQATPEPTPEHDFTQATESTPTPTPEPTPHTTPEPVVLSGSEIFAMNRDAAFQIRLIGEGWSGWGSGFFISSTGTAVTNHHVLLDAIEAYVVMYDGTTFEIMGFYSYDIDNDLAIIRVGNANDVFTPASLGNSDELVVGENVFALGGPDGDSLTFTPGGITRFAREPINFGIYTVSGMIQHSAAIYGGNSGGPLFNDRGQVVGVNSARRDDRLSTQWAVPINRVVVPMGGMLNPLPLRLTPTQVDGQITFLAQFPFIPDLTSVSRDVSLIMSGTPVDLGETSGLFYDLFDYLILYGVHEDDWIHATDLYDEYLMERGFIFQNVVHWGDETWVYLFHPGYNVSLSYFYTWGYNMLMVGIGRGDIYNEFYHSNEAQVPDHDQLFLDLALVGAWEFVETSNDQYLSWMNDGLRLFYEFEGDGTGIFFAFDSSWSIRAEYFFNWSVDDDEVVVYIVYTDINLILTYYYEYDMYGNLLLTDGIVIHHLVFTE